MKLRSTLLALVLFGGAAACSDDHGQTSTSTTDTVATTSTTDTTPTTATTAVPSTTNPDSTSEPTSTGPTTTVAGDADWLAVVQTLGQRRQDLYANPDVSRIAEVCADKSQCADQLNVQIGDLASKGWRVKDADPFVPLNARVEKFDGSTVDTSLLVSVIVVIERANNAGTIVDASGAVVAPVEPSTSPGHNAQGRFTLGRVGPAEDPWRLVSQDTLPEVPA
jgi:hypothetical protein